MLDLVVTDGLVVDGTGVPGRYTDVGIENGRIVTTGRLGGTKAKRKIDASGMVVAPGIVDPHTHYDPQLTWDPACDTSVLHGVTTVVAGNCGFSIAPCRPNDHDYLAQMFARVEGMDLKAFAHIPWRFETFSQFLDSLRGNIGVNVGMYVGHSALRRYVMGEAAYERASTKDELDQIALDRRSNASPPWGGHRRTRPCTSISPTAPSRAGWPTSTSCASWLTSSVATAEAPSPMRPEARWRGLTTPTANCCWSWRRAAVSPW